MAWKAIREEDGLIDGREQEKGGDHSLEEPNNAHGHGSTIEHTLKIKIRLPTSASARAFRALLLDQKYKPITKECKRLIPLCGRLERNIYSDL